MLPESSVNTILISVIGGGVTIGTTAMLAYFRRLNNLILKQAESITRLETQVKPLWARVQRQISKDLHHPDAKFHEMDTLLERLEDLTILPEERVRLKTLLIDRSVDMHPDVSDEQRKKAKLMIGVMELVVLEAAKPESDQAKMVMSRGTELHISPLKSGDEITIVAADEK